MIAIVQGGERYAKSLKEGEDRSWFIAQRGAEDYYSALGRRKSGINKAYEKGKKSAILRDESPDSPEGVVPGSQTTETCLTYENGARKKGNVWIRRRM